MSFNITNLDSGLKEVAEWLAREYSHVHTGRATPIVLDSVMVESYGSLQPIKNVGSITVEDARTLRVSIWDKSLIKEVEKAINASNLGLSVASDSEGARVIFPVLTTENRTRLVKALKDKLEHASVLAKNANQHCQNSRQQIFQKMMSAEQKKISKSASMQSMQNSKVFLNQKKKK